MENFGTCTERIRNLREKVMSMPNYIDTERALIITESYRRYESQPAVLKRALALKDILEKMTLTHVENDMLMGYQSSILRAAPIFPEYSIDWLLEEIDDFEKRKGDSYLLTDQQKDDIRKIHPFWHGRTLQDRAMSIMSERSVTIENIGIIRALNMITCGDGHIAPNMSKLLKIGISGFIKEAEAKKEELDISSLDGLRQRMFLDAAAIVLNAVVCYAHRNADYAENLAKSVKDEEYRKELLKMACICRRVPEYPPETFRESIQFVWFIQLLLQLESNGHSYSMGRVDQYLYPFYKKEIDGGTIDNESASELLENLFIKLYTINKIRPWKYTQFSAGCPMYENVTIGGQTPDGKDAVNELSFLILQAVARNHLTQPNLSVRYHSNMSAEFMGRCIDVIKEGFGMPAFNNDEIIIPSLIKWGVSKEDACDYSAIGCVEVAVPGKWGYRCTGMSFMNLSKIFNMVLRGGYDDVSGLKLYDGRKLVDMNDFDDLFHEWERVCRLFTRESVIIDLACDTSTEDMVPDILCSALVDDCIARGKTIKEGGAVYDLVSGLQVGIANLGNSMAAIKKVVFEDKAISKEVLMKALDTNFAGPDGRRIQQLLINAPKYGCEDDYADKLTVDAYNVYVNGIVKYPNSRKGRGPIGGHYFAGTSSISANVPSGAVVSATPDGRAAGAPLAEGCSPFSGTDIYGPTAVFKSVSKLPVEKITGGVLLNQKVMPSCLITEENSIKLAMLIRTFFDTLKGFHVQYNIFSRETLEDAKVNPSKHRDLIVRVAGYSAFFTVLSPETQDDIIARTEHVI